ncbi:MAG: hypothetical protein ACTHN0_05615 [Aquihabitans sp.]
MIRKMLIGAAMLVVAAAAPAAAQTYDANVSPGTVVAGQEVTLSGEGCVPGSTVSVKVTQRATGTIIFTGSDVTDSTGGYTFKFKMPSDAAPGWYDLEARCPNGATSADRVAGTVEGNDLVWRLEILVVAPSTPTTVPSSGSAPIVRTGSDLNGLGLAGAGLIAAGGIILIATRGRRHAARA